jgi:transcriptional regulator with GAF, ATPase, and Fis domain
LGNGERLDVSLALGAGNTLPHRLSPVPASPTLYEVIPELPPSPSSHEPLTGIVTLDAAMKAHIERVLVATRGRIEGRDGTAALLGINPHTLRARMRKLGIDWSRYRSR